ncbi:MAG TPA: Nramp family divalent metal transporter [Candidatus Saccharibacteria bacterium]|nr:Nramp family divalent metal transporter [Candidatus Saccharibacteria bacterium]
MKKNIIQRSAEAPAELLDKTINATKNLGDHTNVNRTIEKSKEYWHILGPGLTTGASDDDPSGIVTYSQAGAKFGFSMLWMSIFTLPFMAIVQEMCARIGLVTGQGLAANIRKNFSKKLLYTSTLLLFAANSFNIGADLGAMAQVTQLLYPSWNFSLIVLFFVLATLGLQIFTPYEKYAKFLKWMALVLFAYIASALLANLNWNDILKHAIIPSIEFNKDQILLICAVLGTTISPYLFFWQTSQEVENAIARGETTLAQRRNVTKEQVHDMRVDVWSGMLLANVVMFFIIAACGAILFPNGINDIESAAQAAEALRPFAGDLTYFLFAIGIIGTGLLAIPVLAGSSSYAIAESFKWREGLNKKLRQAYAFYGIIIISMLIGLIINFIGLNPIKALIYSAIANGIVAPMVLVPIVIISSNKKIMGEWVNKPLTKVLGWIIVVIMSIAGIASIISILL